MVPHASQHAHFPEVATRATAHSASRVHTVTGAGGPAAAALDTGAGASPVGAGAVVPPAGALEGVRHATAESARTQRARATRGLYSIRSRRAGATASRPYFGPGARFLKAPASVAHSRQRSGITSPASAWLRSKNFSSACSSPASSQMPQPSGQVSMMICEQ